MANQEHHDVLKQGVGQWNKWRKQHPKIRPDLHGADLSNANLERAHLDEVDLSEANLSDTFLRDADLFGANLSGTNLSKAFMFRVSLGFAHLDHATLSEANLSQADLGEADLHNANLRGADLSSANLGANLNNANLSNANLNGANLSTANLSNADLSNADLSFATLSLATLSGTNLQGATLAGGIFAHIDLRQVKGLAEIKHRGPSRVELHTIQLPRDGSALRFLRGCGVPDEWIDFWRSTMLRPIQYHSLFISYSSKDDLVARRLHADLQASGVRCWFAPEDLKIGSKFRQHIDEAIHLQDKLLLLLSEYSVASTWVESEVEAALEKENQQQREVLIPIRLDDAVMQTSQAWAATLRRTRHIGDFTNWTDPQMFQQAFERLLRDLKAENEAKGKTDG